MSASGSPPRSHRIGILMSPVGPFLQCRDCQLSYTFPDGAKFGAIAKQFESHLCLYGSALPVSVKRTLRKGPTGQWEYGETKRAGSRRIIRLQNWVLEKLKDLKQCQTESPVVDPEEWPEAMDLIFVTEFGRPVNVNSLVYKHFKPILKRAGLPNIRLYDLRHTAATLALTVGVSPKVVSEQLGHASAAFTLDVYSHVLPHMQDDAAAKVEAALMG